MKQGQRLGYTVPNSLPKDERGIWLYKDEEKVRWKDARACDRLLLLLLEHHPEQKSA